MSDNKEKAVNSKKNLHSGHRQRVKQAVAESGIEHLKDYQVLELMLFYALPRVDTNPIAHELINEFGSLKGVLEASEGELCRVNGIGRSAAELIKLFRTVSLRYMYENSLKKKSRSVKNTDDIRLIFENRFHGMKNEEVHAAAFDETCTILGSAVISHGDPIKVKINARLLVDFAMKHASSRLVIAHNHPTGVCLPSKEDLVLTADLVKTLAKLEINLFDHVIVGTDGSISLRASDYSEGIWKDERKNRIDK